MISRMFIIQLLFTTSCFSSGDIMNELRSKIIEDIQGFYELADESTPKDQIFEIEEILGVSRYIINLGIYLQDAELTGYGVFLKKKILSEMKDENNEVVIYEE